MRIRFRIWFRSETQGNDICSADFSVAILDKLVEIGLLLRQQRRTQIYLSWRNKNVGTSTGYHLNFALGPKLPVPVFVLDPELSFQN
jgi:hypothetical protein